MRKTYPYLVQSYTPNLDNYRTHYNYYENSFTPDLNIEQEKKHFLEKIDDIVNQRQYVNITLLDWNEDPIKEIDGIISSGSLSKDGSSSVRRSCSLSCSVDGGKYNVDEMEMDFSLNKKVFIEIGIKNDTDEYPEWPILWFPQGVFYINSFSINSSTSSAVNLSIQLKDKMCLLNGEVGGTLPATVQFDTMTTQLADGTITEQKVLYYNIINELVHHWGEEDLNNIIIQDIPLRIRRVMQWTGDNPLFLWAGENVEDGYQISLEDNLPSGTLKYEYGDDVGYVYSDFVPVSEITGSAGDTVCTILDTIKNQLGNYEYFYDVFGIFHFREIKNYLNITQSNIILQETGNQGRHINLEEGQFLLDTGSEIQYLVETNNEKTVYAFDDARNITSISITPNYSNIKNDFIVDGIHQSQNSDQQLPLRFRIVIDEKPHPTLWVNSQNEIDNNNSNNTIPAYGCFENFVYYTHPETYNDQVILETNRLAKPISTQVLPEVGNMDQVYAYDKSYYLWTGKGYTKLYLKQVKDLNDPKANTEDPEFYEKYYPIDWRTFLLCQGLEANANGTDPGPYFSDLSSFWYEEYDLRKTHQSFFGEQEDKSIQYKTLTQGNYFFDIIDASTSTLGMYSIQNIGRRIDVYNEDDINCLFIPEIPNVVFLNKDDAMANQSENTSITELLNNNNVTNILETQKQECINNEQPYVQVSEEIYSHLVTGGYKNSAYETIRYELFNHTTYQKVVSITSLPVFYLEPNSRVQVTDRSTNTYGDFMIQNINLTFGPGANMSVNMNEVSERL